MRSTKVVPIGQGCKAAKFIQVTLNAPNEHRCLCHPHLYIHRCTGCGDLFHSSAPHTKTCSNRCRMRLSRIRHSKMFQMVLTYANGN